MAKEDAITRVTLLVPGPERLRRKRTPAKAEWIENDGAFGRAFSFGTCSPDEVEAIDAAAGALLLEWTVDLREGREAIVAAVDELRGAGALAVRLEQSKLGWPVGRWLELLSADDPWGWHRAAVVFLNGEEATQSCGMHAFSLPEVRVPLDAGAEAAQELGTTLNVYQLGEDPVIRSGQTFSPDARSPKRVLERWPDVGYPPDHWCHNPYGVWRMGPPGGTGRPMAELVPVFMPSLCVLLRALEAKEGRLTRARIEAIRDGGVCMTMDPRHEQQLERRRGYSDLDPELVWDQWQLLREHRP